MNYYTLQVKTRSEEQYIKRVTLCEPAFRGGLLSLHFPRRRMNVRRKGKNLTELAPVFPGYIFLRAEGVPKELFWTLRSTEGFFRFLPQNSDPAPLEGTDLAIVKHFMSFGPVAEKSRVSFDSDDHIQILDGPLKGLEGRIVKVDKRKGRAKVKLDMYNEPFLIDLSFEIILRT